MSPRPLFTHAEFDVLARPALALAGVEPNVGDEFFGPLEAAHIANNGQEREGVDEAHAEHLHGAQHQGLRAHLGSNEPVEALAALFAGIEIAEVLGKDLALQGGPVPVVFEVRFCRVLSNSRLPLAGRIALPLR